MTELKPCPFCGGEADIFDYWNEWKKKYRWVVMCTNCKGGLGELDTKEEAIEKWNNRWMIPCEEGETEGNWHTGTPTEDGDYICAFRQSDDSIEYGWCEWDGKGFDILCDYDPLVTPIVAWMPIPPFEASKEK